MIDNKPINPTGTTLSISYEAPKTLDKKGFEELEWNSIEINETRLNFNEFTNACIKLNKSIGELAESIINNSSLCSEITGVASVPDFVLINNKRYSLTQPKDHSKHRDHGWYNKFNKPHGKRNLKS